MLFDPSVRNKAVAVLTPARSEIWVMGKSSKNVKVCQKSDWICQNHTPTVSIIDGNHCLLLSIDCCYEQKSLFLKNRW